MKSARAYTLGEIWRVPLALALLTSMGLAVGLIWDGLWDWLATALLVLPVLCFVERLAKAKRLARQATKRPVR